MAKDAPYGMCKKHKEPYRMAGSYRVCGKCKSESGKKGGDKKHANRGG